MENKRLTWLFGALIISPPSTRYFSFGVELAGLVFNLPRISMIACSIFAALSFISCSKYRLSYSDIGVLSLFLLLMFSVMWSIAPGESARRASDLLFYFVYFSSIVVYFNRRSAFRVFLTLLLVPATVAVTYSALKFVYSPSGWELTVLSRNGVSRDMLAMLPILFFSLYGQNRVQTIVRLVLAGLIVVLVPLSGSRSGLVALIIALVLVLITWGNQVKKLSFRYLATVSVVGSVLIGAGLAIALTVGVLPERLLRIPVISDGISPETLGNARYQVRLAEIGTIKEYPLLGIGYGAFYQYSAVEFGIGNYRAHSLVTRVWMGAGIPGLVLLFITGSVVSRNYIRRAFATNTRETLCLTGCFIGLTVTTLTGMFNIVITQPLFYLLVGIGSSATVMSTQSRSNSVQ